MGAYILRRVLLIIPTMIGIMAISFLVVQFAPGGPVERIIAQLQGTDVSATARDRRRRRRLPGRRPAGRGQRRDNLALPGRPGSRPRVHRGAREAVRLRQAGARALRPDAVELRPFRLRRELLPRHQRRRPDHREAAGVDLARAVDDVPVLRHLDPARHPEGDEGRLALRHLDQRGDHRRLRDPGVPVRHPAHHPLRRRQLLRLVSAPRPVVGPLRQHAVLGMGHRPAGAGRLLLAPGPAADGDGARRPSRRRHSSPRIRSSTRSASST
jgi:hypothetical protein